jgi:hypothetical protein
MSNVTPLFASRPAKKPSRDSTKVLKPQIGRLTPELRAGLDQLKKELQIFLEDEERQ